MTAIHDIIRGRKSLRAWTSVFALVTLLSCNGQKGSTPSQRVSFWRKDKQPYGTYIAYESLPHLFPNSEITVNRNDIASLSQKEGKKAMIFIGFEAKSSPSEINALLNFVGNGNHV